MSIFPVFNASFAGLILLGLFLWDVYLLLIVIICVVLSIFLYVSEGVDSVFHYMFGFCLFIFSEIIIFGTLFFCCLYFDYGYYPNLSSSLELPFLGCFILFSSSVTVTAYHHLLNWYLDWLPLLITVVLGLGFVALQIIEMEEIIMNICDTTFHATSLCVIGLHFTHVLLGVIALFTILVVGSRLFGWYNCSIIVLYWHFVDYIWLFVYMLIYVC